MRNPPRCDARPQRRDGGRFDTIDDKGTFPISDVRTDIEHDREPCKKLIAGTLSRSARNAAGEGGDGEAVAVNQAAGGG